MPSTGQRDSADSEGRKNPEEQSPEERFSGELVSEYDSGIRRMLPGYELLHELARSLLHAELGDEARVLVAGCGTGMEIASLGEGRPRWYFTGVDPSADMVAIAERRMAKLGIKRRVDLRVGLTDELPTAPPYDAATAILVMHFLPDDGTKLELLESIAVRLESGAPLVLADACGERSSPRFSRFMSAWRQRQLTLGMAESDTDERFREVLSAVHFVPEERIGSLLEEAGFGEATRFYGALLFSGWVAYRE